MTDINYTLGQPFSFMQSSSVSMLDGRFEATISIFDAGVRVLRISEANSNVLISRQEDSITFLTAANVMSGLTAKTYTYSVRLMKPDLAEIELASGNLVVYGTPSVTRPAAGTLTFAYPMHYRITPVNAGNTTVHAAITLPDADTLDVATAITNPDYPRVLSITGSASGITGNVVITGTNINDEAITDTIALSGASTVNGTKAFKTVTNINVPAKTNASGDTVAVGVTKLIGLPHVVASVAQVFLKIFDGTAETGTVARDNAVEKNLYTIAGTPNGAKIVDIYYYQG